MDDETSRQALDALIRERGEDYASLSRLLGRNPTYVQQYVKRGVPRRLADADRRLLARYFGVSPASLGGANDDGADDYVEVPLLRVGASAGPGAITDDEDRRQPPLAFRTDWLRRLSNAPASALSIIQVVGDSMAPTLQDGDDILVDSSDAADRLRDGIYVLRVDEALIVKRLALKPTGGFAIRSDNPDYPSWPDADLSATRIIGRVVWHGRRLR